MHPVTLNWLAIVVAAFVVYVLGAIWFSPVLFQKPWARLAGMDQQPPDPGAMALGMVLGALVGSFTQLRRPWWCRGQEPRISSRVRESVCWLAWGSSLSRDSS